MHAVDEDLLEQQYRKLDGKKAIGIDDITKAEYGKDLANNLAKLISKIRLDKYRPQPAKIVKIPKEDGGERPLAISCFENKLVQSAIRELLSIIYEPIFLTCSYMGFVPIKTRTKPWRSSATLVIVLAEVRW